MELTKKRRMTDPIIPKIPEGAPLDRGVISLTMATLLGALIVGAMFCLPIFFGALAAMGVVISLPEGL